MLETARLILKQQEENLEKMQRRNIFHQSSFS